MRASRSRPSRVVGPYDLEQHPERILSVFDACASRDATLHQFLVVLLSHPLPLEMKYSAKSCVLQGAGHRALALLSGTAGLLHLYDSP